MLPADAVEIVSRLVLAERPTLTGRSYDFWLKLLAVLCVLIR